MRANKKEPFWFLAGLLAVLLISSSSVFAQNDEANKAKELYNQAIETSNATEAEKLYKAAISHDPTFIDAYINLGALYFSNKNYDEAAKTFKQATEKDPKSADAFVNLGRVNYTLRRWAEAESAFNSAIALDPKNADYYKELGKVYYKLGRDNYSQMIDAFQKCHANGGGDYLTYYLIGKGYKEQGDNAKAIAAYKTSIELKEKNDNAHFALGQIYLSQENYSTAAGEFHRALNLDPKSWRAAYNYAVAKETGDPENYKDNIAAWEQFIKVAKKNPQANKDLNVAEAHVKELKDALEQAQLQ